MAMDSGLPLVLVQIILRQVAMELYGPVAQVLLFFLYVVMAWLMAMVYGLLLEAILVTPLQRVLMELLGPVGVIVFFLLLDMVFIMVMDSGLPLEEVLTLLPQVPMELYGRVVVLPFFLVVEPVWYMPMDSGLPLDSVQTQLLLQLMELTGSVVGLFCHMPELVLLMVLLITLKRGLSTLLLCMFLSEKVQTQLRRVRMELIGQVADLFFLILRPVLPMLMGSGLLLDEVIIIS
jgi:hypothetical protein